MSAPSPFAVFLSAASALLLVHPSLAFLAPPSFLSFGYCKDVPVQPGIDFREFSGLWYTAEKVPNEYDPDVACTNTRYAFYGDHLRSSQKGLLADRSKHKINTVLIPDNQTDPTLIVHNPGVPLAPLKILSTDYQTYACMYTCMDFVAFKAEFAFTLTRSPLAKQSSLQTCRDVYSEEAGLDPASMVLIEQGKTCPYWSTLSSNVTELHLRGENQVQADWTDGTVPPPPSRQRRVNSATSPSSPVFSITLLLFTLLMREISS